jgi:DDE superfamily endonuclease/Helix-turn-helix of DDE superfamily endonuclease
LSLRAFRRLVGQVRRRGGARIADGRPGRQWALPLEDRVLLVAVYWRTNLTMRQVGPLFGISHAAAHRVIDTVGPLLALAPLRRRRTTEVAIVDGTLVPTRDRSLAVPSKNYRHSANLQVAIDASTRLILAVGAPLPGSRNDSKAFTESGIHRQLAGRPVMADGGYQGTGLIIPFRARRDGRPLPGWQERSNAEHRRIRARIEHTFARMKCWKILRDHRQRASRLWHTTAGIATLHNLAITG